MARLLSVLFALCAISAHGANIERDSVACTDGSYATTGVSADCRPFTSSLTFGDMLADTSTNADAVVDITSGTFYAYIDDSADPAPASCAAIVTPSGQVDASTVTITSTTVSMSGANNFSGLTGETMYRLFGCAVLGARVEKGFQTSEIGITQATPGLGGTDLTGTGKFLALNDAGNTDETPTSDFGNGATCTSMANACDQFADLGVLGTGENFYLCEGCVWPDQTLTISHGGSSGDPAEVKCYFDEGDDDGNPVLCESF